MYVRKGHKTISYKGHVLTLPHIVKNDNALVWLKENNPLYKEMIIGRSRLDELPVCEDVNVSVRFIYHSQCTDCDRDLVEENEAFH